MFIRLFGYYLTPETYRAIKNVYLPIKNKRLVLKMAMKKNVKPQSILSAQTGHNICHLSKSTVAKISKNQWLTMQASIFQLS